MKRILEPELMEDFAQVAAYARADFSDSIRWYLDRLIAEFPSSLRTVVDLGCGPADVAVQLSRLRPDTHVTAVDGSRAMLDHAQRAVHAAGLDQQVSLHCGYIPGLALPDGAFDAILSKDFLHHLPDPAVLWQEARRLGRPGAAVFVMDLIRPATPEAAHALVERVAAGADPILKQDFFNSLCAAFTVEEVQQQVTTAGLALKVTQATERHLLISGVL